MEHQQRYCHWRGRLLVNTVDIQILVPGDPVVEGVHSPFVNPPIVFPFPIGDESPQVFEIRSIHPGMVRNLDWPSNGNQPMLQIVQNRIWDGYRVALWWHWERLGTTHY